MASERRTWAAVVGYATSLIFLYALAASCAGGDFAGDTGATQPPAPLTDDGNPLTPAGQDGSDANDGGDGNDDDGRDDGGDGRDDSGDGGDDDGDDGIDLGDDENKRTREALIIIGDKEQDETTIRLRWIGSSEDGDWVDVGWPDKGQRIEVEDICHKTRDTEIEIELSGGDVFGARPPHEFIGKKSGFGTALKVGFESSGTCGIFNSGILASDCHDDSIARFECPQGNLRIKGL